MARVITGLLFALLFAAAAFVQRDDADGESVFWIITYGVVAVFSLLFAAGVLPRRLAWPVAVTALAVAGGLAVQQHLSGEPWNPDTQFLAETVREAGGMTLIGVWLLAAGAVGCRRRQPTTAASGATRGN
ncbi:MAG: transmembrane 220 family protein [Planctomycetota bacterium]|jgi:hypothetical protein